MTDWRLSAQTGPGLQHNYVNHIKGLFQQKNSMGSPNQVSKKQQIHFLIFSAVVSIAILAYLFTKVSLAEVINAIRGVSLSWIVLFLVFSFSMSLFRTWRYQLVLNVSGYRVDSVVLFLITLVRNFFSDLLPARLGTLIYVYLVKSRLGLPLGPILSSFAHAFIFDIISLSLLIIPAVSLVVMEGQPGRGLLPVGVALAALSIGILILLPALCRLGVRICERITFIPQRWRSKLNDLLGETAHHLELARKQGVYFRLLALSFGVRLCKYISYYMLFVGLVIPLGYTVGMLNPGKVFLGLCSAEMAASLPVSGIAGFGAYEGAWALVFQLLGYPERIAILTSISHHLFTQVYGYLLGGAALLILLLPMFRNRGFSMEELSLPVKFWFQYVATILVITVTTVLLFPSNDSVASKGAGSSQQGGVSEISSRIPEGKVVYERPDGIYVKSLQAIEDKKISDGGKHPRWSWDGRYIVFIRDGKIVLYSTRDKKTRELATVKSPGTVSFHPDNISILFSDKTKLYRFNLKTGAKREVITDGDFRELGISRDGNRLAATVKTLTGYKVRVFDLSGGGVRTVSKGCSASISPSGGKVTVNGPKHKTLKLFDWGSLKHTATIPSPSGLKFDNQFWSNKDDWVASATEGEERNIYLHNAVTGKYFKVTSTNDCDRPHIFIY